MESPAVCLFSIFAVVIDRLPSESATARVIELFILVSSALFAFWMIGVRHIYRHVAKAGRKQQKESEVRKKGSVLGIDYSPSTISVAQGTDAEKAQE